MVLLITPSILGYFVNYILRPRFIIIVELHLYIAQFDRIKCNLLDGMECKTISVIAHYFHITKHT